MGIHEPVPCASPEWDTLCIPGAKLNPFFEIQKSKTNGLSVFNFRVVNKIPPLFALAHSREEDEIIHDWQTLTMLIFSKINEIPSIDSVTSLLKTVKNKSRSSFDPSSDDFEKEWISYLSTLNLSDDSGMAKSKSFASIGKGQIKSKDDGKRKIPTLPSKMKKDEDSKGDNSSPTSPRATSPRNFFAKEDANKKKHQKESSLFSLKMKKLGNESEKESEDQSEKSLQEDTKLSKSQRRVTQPFNLLAKKQKRQSESPIPKILPKTNTELLRSSAPPIDTSEDKVNTEVTTTWHTRKPSAGSKRADIVLRVRDKYILEEKQKKEQEELKKVKEIDNDGDILKEEDPYKAFELATEAFLNSDLFEDNKITSSKSSITSSSNELSPLPESNIKTKSTPTISPRKKPLPTPPKKVTSNQLTLPLTKSPLSEEIIPVRRKTLDNSKSPNTNLWEFDKEGSQLSNRGSRSPTTGEIKRKPISKESVVVYSGSLQVYKTVRAQPRTTTTLQEIDNAREDFSSKRSLSEKSIAKQLNRPSKESTQNANNTHLETETKPSPNRSRMVSVPQNQGAIRRKLAHQAIIDAVYGSDS